MTTFPAHLFERIEYAPSGCLIWTGLVNPLGYGRIRYQGRSLKVHRLAFESFVGPIAEGLVLDHLCHTEAVAHGTCRGGASCLHRRCVRPDHLEAVTRLVNNQRGVGNQHRGKTHCKHGHEFTPENTMLRTDSGPGARRCRTCDNLRYLRRRAARDES